MRHTPVRIAVAAVLTVGVVGGGAIAVAQEEPSVSDEAAPAPDTGSTTGGPARVESFVADVAAELGVSPDELDGAVRAVLTDRIDSAQAEGRLDAETADDLIAAVADGTLREVVRDKLAERDPRRPWYGHERPLPPAEG